MIFKKEDEIILDGHKYHCVIADEVQAIFALVVPHYYEENNEVKYDGDSFFYEHLIGLYNDESLEDNIDYIRCD